MDNSDNLWRIFINFINNFNFIKMNIRHTIKPSGPGDNIFLKENVKTNGEIILEVKKENPFMTLAKNDWTCSEVSWPAKYGIYQFELEVPVFLPRGLVCGVFLYQDDKHEVDIEFSRWNKFFNKNCQFVNQEPFESKRFWNFTRNNKIIVVYKKDNIGLSINGITHVFYKEIKNAQFMINLWIYGEPAEAKVKVKNFKFTKT